MLLIYILNHIRPCCSKYATGIAKINNAAKAATLIVIFAVQTYSWNRQKQYPECRWLVRQWFAALVCLSFNYALCRWHAVYYQPPRSSKSPCLLDACTFAEYLGIRCKVSRCLWFSGMQRTNFVRINSGSESFPREITIGIHECTCAWCPDFKDDWLSSKYLNYLQVRVFSGHMTFRTVKIAYYQKLANSNYSTMVY